MSSLIAQNMLQYVFKEIELHRVYLCASEENVRAKNPMNIHSYMEVCLW